jgi:hypothetical protein
LKGVIVSVSKNSSTARSSSVVLEPLAKPELAPPVSRIEGRPLRPEPFRPESGRPDEADGRPLSKFGWQFREVFAQYHQVDPSDVDLGLVRQAEALNADTDRNLAALRAVQAKRTEHGTLHYVRMLVNTPLLEPWLLNGRALRRMGAELRGQSRVVTTATDHPLLKLPTMEVDGPETVLDIIAAQRRLLFLESYTSTGSKPLKRARVDSIVQFGVLEPPDVVLVQLRSKDGSAWVAQAAEGAQRLFSALVGMDQLASRSVGLLAAEHWLKDAPGLRDLTPADLDRLTAELAFPASAAAGYFPGRDTKLFLEETATRNPAAVAFQLLRTVEISLIIAVEPDPQVTAGEHNPVSSTIQEMIRSYHVPGKAKDQWELADVQGLIAIGVVDELLGDGRITEADRSAWLGETMPTWDGDPTRLLSVARLVATLTAQKAALSATGSGEDSIEYVNRHLRLNGQRVHTDERAKVAAAQAVVALGMNGTGKENTLAAAIYGAFHAPWFWRTDDHAGGRWPALLGTPIQELRTKALAEAKASTDDASCGPAQRALAALGGLALMSNPGLLAEDKALTRTARGGGGKATNVKASDPNVLLAAMVKQERGIDQLYDAVIALTANAEPTIPLDREDSHELDEFYLRDLWLGESITPKEDNPLAEFARRVNELANAIVAGGAEADFLRDAPPGDVIGLERSEDDDPDLWDGSVYERIGITEQTASDALPALQNLVDFFTTGKALARAAARAAR